ncbi:hypothetical protein Tco_0872359 [Tanacetum coccineum]
MCSLSTLRALRVQRASVHDLYERMGSMEIRQEGAYNPPGYAQPQYDQYYQQYYPQQPPQQQHDDEEDELCRMTRVGYVIVCV